MSDLFIIKEWRPYTSGSLQGFFSVELPSGLEIRKMSFHRKEDGSSWASFPQERYEKDGEIKYAAIVRIEDKPVGCVYAKIISNQAQLQSLFLISDTQYVRYN